ncbi:hypothetical protein Acy02nite_80340 [Actinoplanes cyaneus]|uniref:DUF7711 domain-containing protein n=1 Tax=Actinoplanes cyaneus TaxID=52696 RepID=A0A919IUX9_9ACTN|nr:hypothetical protein [Actinoplanes cyaneus]MCW2140807.1 hypothetical protein [Actinoplanes cyaneus]GID70153.1 hypothetical protein Acy02nite_80340 [Actinoplanes cyaneus]
MKHATAVKRLHTLAERCQVAAMRHDAKALVSVYAFGAVLDSKADLECPQVAVVLDEQPEELPWSVRPPIYGSLPHFLELDKGAVAWFWRSAARPVANHYILRPLRIWSRDSGPDTEALDALRAGDTEKLRLPAPADADLRAQLTEELATSLAYLRRVRDNYWDQQWRRDNRGGPGVFAENLLWDATDGYFDLLDATTQRPAP